MTTHHNYPWGHTNRYNDYSTYMRRKFTQRVQKISVDAGFSCPNRDGSISTGGCTYCDNTTFSPFYCTSKKSVTEQLDEGIRFFSRKYDTMQFMAYFQAYTNTHAPVDVLESRYREALAMPEIIGLVIATRPDCVDNQKLDMIARINETHPVTIEFGIESTLDSTLTRINRGHTFAQTQEAVHNTALRGIDTCGHLILGLPGESSSDMLCHARRLSALPLTSIKLHQLQIVRNTPMAADYALHKADYYLFSAASYVAFAVDFLEVLSPLLVVERFISQSPPGTVLAPHWGGLKNFEIAAMIEKELQHRNTWQGRLFIPNDK